VPGDDGLDLGESGGAVDGPVGPCAGDGAGHSVVILTDQIPRFMV